MRISCTGAKCAVTEVEYMASGAINYFTASFTFDSAWSDFISANKLYGIFEGSDSVILTTLVYNSETQAYDCDVPWETIKYQGELLVGVIGHLTTPETKILTTNMAFGYKIPEGAATNATTGSQSSGLLLEVLEAAEQVGADADRAEVAVTHFPYIDPTTNNWFKWDVATEVFVDTGVNATGPAAGFGIPTISVAQGAEGTQPQAVITATGPNTAKVFDFDFTIPKGDTGNAAEILINSTTTGEAGTDASVTNIGDEHVAILDFLIPQGIQGNTGAAAGFGAPTSSVTTGAPGTNASLIITPSGLNTAKVFDFDFTLPKGDTGTAAEITIGTTETGAPGTDAQVTNSGDEHFAVLHFTIPQGLTGAEGEDGISITSIIKTNTVGLVDTYTITFSNATTTTFTVTNGQKGDTGDNFVVLGHYDTLAALQAAVPSPNTGDGYSIGTATPYNIYIFDGILSAWIDYGTIQGPTGTTGAKGEATYWHTGTTITGTSTSDTIFSGSGITLANIKDLYLNTETDNIYKCTLGGNAFIATWIYIGNIKGAAGADASIDIVRW